MEDVSSNVSALCILMLQGVEQHGENLGYHLEEAERRS